jgi:hypothetical protein
MTCLRETALLSIFHVFPSDPSSSTAFVLPNSCCDPGRSQTRLPPKRLSCSRNHIAEIITQEVWSSDRFARTCASFCPLSVVVLDVPTRRVQAEVGPRVVDALSCEGLARLASFPSFTHLGMCDQQAPRCHSNSLILVIHRASSYRGNMLNGLSKILRTDTISCDFFD